MNTKNTLQILTLLIITAFSLQTIKAQTTLGGGLAYGTEIENIGIDVTGQYFLKDNMAIETSFTYYLPKDIGLGSDFQFKWSEFNANLNYYFNANGNISPYGIGGINMTFLSSPDITGSLFGGGEIKNTTSSEFGLNIGVGADFSISDSITPFAHLKYVLGNADQLQILGGVRFEL